MLLNKNDTVLCIGDSITDTGRARPIGEGRNDERGTGYVHLLFGLLGSKYPELNIRVQNLGISGNTTRDLEARWQTDVMDLTPDCVTIMIGANDVWRQFDSQNADSHVYIDEYTATFDKLVAKTLKMTDKVVLLTPFFIEPETTDKMRATMDIYGGAVRAIADKYALPFVDTQAGFNRILEHTPSAQIAWDRVHPNVVGHTLIANLIIGAFESL